MRKILLSINPKYAHRIFDEQSKRYEYRKRVPVDVNIHTAVVYETAPKCKVIGEFDYDDIITGSPAAVWELTKDASGITKVDYDIYFDGCKLAHAFAITQVRQYHREMELWEFGLVRVPQSWIYIDAI